MATTDATPLELSDEELAAEAVVADPEPDLADAVPFATVTGDEPDAGLPAWYMPTPTGGARLSGWRRGVVYTFVLALLVIEAFGLCTTFGPGF
jgi:hypothetical protein